MGIKNKSRLALRKFKVYSQNQPIKGEFVVGILLL